MAKTRAEREADFRSLHGVSSGTYYEMRRKATDEGISPKTFDAVALEAGYADAKRVAQIARTDVEMARYTAAIHTGLISSDVAFSDFDDALDYVDIPDDYDWWYH